MTEEKSVETRALEMGWAPKEQFRGDPAKWVDAETYVDRGENLMPILRANNRKMTEELATLRNEVAATKNLLKASAESIDALKEFNTEAARKVAREEAASLKSALVQAKKDGDVEKEVELTEQLTEHTAALKKADETKKITPKETPPDYTKSPEWQAWVGENDWFGTDKRKTNLAVAITNELRQDPANAGLLGKAFLDKVTEEVEKTLGVTNPRTDKVEGNARSSASTNGNGRSYADLPQDAKEACERQAKKLVGEGRAFKTESDWRKHYAKTFWEIQ